MPTEVELLSQWMQKKSRVCKKCCSQMGIGRYILPSCPSTPFLTPAKWSQVDLLPRLANENCLCRYLKSFSSSCLPQRENIHVRMGGKFWQPFCGWLYFLWQLLGGGHFVNHTYHVVSEFVKSLQAHKGGGLLIDWYFRFFKFLDSLPIVLHTSQKFTVVAWGPLIREKQ